MTSKLKFIETSKLPTDVGEFTVHAFTDEKDSPVIHCECILLNTGPFVNKSPIPIAKWSLESFSSVNACTVNSPTSVGSLLVSINFNFDVINR